MIKPVHFESRVIHATAVKTQFWLCNSICAVCQMAHHSTRFTCIGQHSWCEGGSRKNKNLSMPLTYKEVSICQISTKLSLSTCLQYLKIPEYLKNLLLTVLLSSVSCFWMTTSWLCNCKNTACKLFQKEPYLYLLKRLHCNSYTEHFWG